MENKIECLNKNNILCDDLLKELPKHCLTVEEKLNIRDKFGNNDITVVTKLLQSQIFVNENINQYLKFGNHSYQLLPSDNKIKITINDNIFDIEYPDLLNALCIVDDDNYNVASTVVCQLILVIHDQLTKFNFLANKKHVISSYNKMIIMGLHIFWIIFNVNNQSSFDQ